MAALVGALSTLAVQGLLKVIDNWRDIYKMRRVLYRDLLTMFKTVDDIMTNTWHGLPLTASQEIPDFGGSRAEQLRTFMKFSGEAYLQGHQDAYMQLPERRAAKCCTWPIIGFSTTRRCYTRTVSELNSCWLTSWRRTNSNTDILRSFWAVLRQKSC